MLDQRRVYTRRMVVTLRQMVLVLYTVMLIFIIVSTSPFPYQFQTPIAAASQESLSGTGKIAFVSNRDGGQFIFLMNPDGSDVTRLTRGSMGIEYEFVWSPDGERIAFSAEGPSGDRETGFVADAFVINADGTNLVQLTDRGLLASEFSWSPDSQHLVFSWSAPYPGPRSSLLHTIYLDTPGDNIDPTCLILCDYGDQDRFASRRLSDWSPDGQKLVYLRILNREYNIYLANTDGTGERQLTDDGRSFFPRWSPDGERIAFCTQLDEDDEPVIAVMNADGSNLVQLTDNDTFDCQVNWTPDGQQLLFVSGRDGNAEIYIMNADGSNPINLTNDPGNDLNPVWSPDGRYIAFMSQRDGNAEIYVMNADGSNPVNLTQNGSVDDLPAWRPPAERYTDQP